MFLGQLAKCKKKSAENSKVEFFGNLYNENMNKLNKSSNV